MYKTAVARKGANVQIAVLEPRWQKDLLATRPDAIRHEKISGEIVLSASSKEMQRFLLANLKTSEAFSEPLELVRKKIAR